MHAEGGRLLDLGAASGYLGAAVRSHFHKTIGFERDTGCIGTLASRFDRVVIADLETVSRLPKNLDAVVLADVLEHLRDSSTLLRLVRESLAQRGRCFISVPNVANFSVRAQLLFGSFSYQDRGILDRTHVRFYTVRSILDELRRAGFRVITIRSSSVPLRIVCEPHFPEWLIRSGERILSLLTPLWKSMLGYQTILMVEKASA